jgi:hypothetical protein
LAPQYIRHLIYTDLSASTIESVLRQLRKLPWGECSAYVAKVLGRVHKLQYANIHLVASLAAGFTKFHDDLPITLVDQVGCGSSLCRGADWGFRMWLPMGHRLYGLFLPVSSWFS